MPFFKKTLASQHAHVSTLKEEGGKGIRGTQGRYLVYFVGFKWTAILFFIISLRARAH